MNNMKLIMESWRGYVNEQEEGNLPHTDDEALQWITDQLVPLVTQADLSNLTSQLGELVKRLNTAAGKSEAVRSLIIDDGNPEAEAAIPVDTGQLLDPENLTPTQGVIDINKSVGYNGGCAPCVQKIWGEGVSGAPPILACGQSPNYYILDGHHRWSGAQVFNLNCKIPAVVIQMNAAKALLVSQMVIAAKLGAGKDVPSAEADPGASLIGGNRMGLGAVYKYLMKSIGQKIDPNAPTTFLDPGVMKIVAEMQGKWLTKEGAAQIQSEVGLDPNQIAESDDNLKKAVCMQIATNCQGLKQPAENAPPREIMPQFDPDVGGIKFSTDVEKDFEAGTIKWKPEEGEQT